MRSGVNGDAFYISAGNSTIVLADGASGAVAVLGGSGFCLYWFVIKNVKII